MYCSRTRLVLAVAGCAALAACSHSNREESGVPRVAVLPFENLTPDAGMDWLSRATAAAIVYDLTGAPDLYAFRVDSIRDARVAHANRILQGYFAREKGALAFHTTLEDTERRKRVQDFVVHGDGLTASNEIAKKLWPQARTFKTSAQAFQAYGEALLGHTPFEDVVNRDPNFAAAYLTWAESSSAAGRAQQAAEIAANGLRQAHNLDAIDRTELEFLYATAINNAPARLQSVRKLASLLPADGSVIETAGELEFARHEFARAAQDLHQAVAVNPDNAAAWNLLGYTQARQGDFASARTSLERYGQLAAPHDANPLDSLGELSFAQRDFAAAANSFVQAHKTNPAQFAGRELFKAAIAQIMLGDPAQADTLFQQFNKPRIARDPVGAAFEQAQWLFVMGHKRDALAALDKLTAPEARSAAVIATQKALWQIETGAPRSQIKIPFTLPAGVEALLARDFPAAIAPLKQAYENTPANGDGQARLLLAWAYVETGHADAAIPLLRAMPVPFTSGNPVLATLVFPRALYILGAIDRAQGKADQARKYFDIFKQYNGDLPDYVGFKLSDTPPK